MKTKTINIRDPWGCDMTRNEGRFVLSFTSEKYIIKMHFDRNWISCIAEMFWKVIKEEKKDIEFQEAALRGNDD